MIPHKDQWDRLAVDQKLDALRDQAIGHELWVRLLIQAVERLGVHFTTGDDRTATARSADPLVRVVVLVEFQRIDQRELRVQGRSRRPPLGHLTLAPGRGRVYPPWPRASVRPVTLPPLRRPRRPATSR